jgi:hypothetical protein
MKRYGIEYLTKGARVWRRASCTMLNREALETHAAALAMQEGWQEFRVIEI